MHNQFVTKFSHAAFALFLDDCKSGAWSLQKKNIELNFKQNAFFFFGYNFCDRDAILKWSVSLKKYEVVECSVNLIIINLLTSIKEL